MIKCPNFLYSSFCIVSISGVKTVIFCFLFYFLPSIYTNCFQTGKIEIPLKHRICKAWTWKGRRETKAQSLISRWRDRACMYTVLYEYNGWHLFLLDNKPTRTYVFYISIKKRTAAPTKMQLPNSLKISAHAWFFYHAKDVWIDKVALKMFLLKCAEYRCFFNRFFFSKSRPPLPISTRASRLGPRYSNFFESRALIIQVEC